MLRLDILPRLIRDSHCETWDEALAEVARRRASPVAHDAVTRLDESPYGGYRVYTVSLEVAMEVFVDMADSGVFPGQSGTPEPGYRKTTTYR
ncbi:hypothetical protein [Candidatus Palauibacter sp.]|uniref:hypothetical protein n=1 Tax=Candidatus Palauibacter sp. TaxID=3101350 RepID=UPI003B5B7B01